MPCFFGSFGVVAGMLAVATATTAAAQSSRASTAASTPAPALAPASTAAHASEIEPGTSTSLDSAVRAELRAGAGPTDHADDWSDYSRPPADLMPDATFQGPYDTSRMFDDPRRTTPQITTPSFVDDPFPDEDVDPPGARPGAFQKLTLESTWLAPGSHPKDLGVTDVEVRSLFGVPCPTRRTPLLITPGYAIHLFDGPEAIDVPGEVYDAYVQLRWTGRLTPRFRIDMAAWPGWYSDFHQSSGRGFRSPAYLAGIYRWSETLKTVVGVSYLDRRDINFLPIGGLVWAPDDITSVEIVVPKPRAARRIDGGVSRFDPLQLWVYVGGELGGGTWAVQRGDGVSDSLSYRDYRAFLGIERKAFGGLGAWLEAGYVFSRKMQYDNAPESVRPSDTLMVRGGVSY